MHSFFYIARTRPKPRDQPIKPFKTKKPSSKNQVHAFEPYLVKRAIQALETARPTIFNGVGLIIRIAIQQITDKAIASFIRSKFIARDMLVIVWLARKRQVP